MAPRNLLMALFGGMLLWLVSSAVPGEDAKAQCCAPPPPCCTAPPPPPCCTPPTPPPCCTPPAPPPRPPSPPGCCAPGGRTNIIVNANSVAVSVAGAGSGAGGGAVVYGGGGGGGYYAPPTATGVIQGLDVQGVRKTRQVAYQATRTATRRVVIQAFCLDDRDVPHPASQVFPEREVDEAYDGELYRCLAGTRMQVTIAEYLDKVSFEGGQTMICAKGEALYRTRGGAEGGQLACRPQKPARDCNERSLLRRFGAGIKVLTIVTLETYTAYREEVVTESTAASFSMSLDGGVGGTIY
ncbi:MAG: hypothetical protein ACOY4K_04590 [Pseudomonadota bacterium]